MTQLEVLSALLYGFIQGVTEFLPVSSSGHLALIPKFLDWKDPGVAFDLWIHGNGASCLSIFLSSDISSDGRAWKVCDQSDGETHAYSSLLIKHHYRHRSNWRARFQWQAPGRDRGSPAGCHRDEPNFIWAFYVWCRLHCFST